MILRLNSSVHNLFMSETCIEPFSNTFSTIPVCPYSPKSIINAEPTTGVVLFIKSSFHCLLSGIHPGHPFTLSLTYIPHCLRPLGTSPVFSTQILIPPSQSSYTSYVDLLNIFSRETSTESPQGPVFPQPSLSHVFMFTLTFLSSQYSSYSVISTKSLELDSFAGALYPCNSLSENCGLPYSS